MSNAGDESDDDVSEWIAAAANSSNNVTDDDQHINGAPHPPRGKVRLYLRAAGLPRSLTNQQPDTKCRISIGDYDNDTSYDETEIVYKSNHPRYTTSFPLDYEYGSKLLIFVFVYAVGNSNSTSITFGKYNKHKDHNNNNNTAGLKLIGSAMFNVQDVLGMKYQLKARRLNKGGTIYAHIEQEFSSSITASIPRSIHESGSNNSQILTLRLRAKSLVHTRNRFTPSTLISKPDTYFEVSRPAYSTTDMGRGTITTVHKKSASSSWIVVYRSPPVTESVTPLWDEAMIDLNSLCSTAATTADNNLNSYPVLISIYKIKKKQCKEIGSFETTIFRLIEASPSKEEEKEEGGGGRDQEQSSPSFQLQPRASRGPLQSNETTGEISVVSAYVQQSDDVRQQSERILSYDYSSGGDDNDALRESSGSIGSDSINSICLMAADVSVNNGSSSSISPFVTPHRAKFSDYVDAGLNIDFCVAIDFTSSNGSPRIPGTLHYSRDGMRNDYEDAIETIGNTVEKYSREKQFPTWGFGAKYDGEVRHIFQCGQEPAANGVQGVLDAYRSVFESDVIMSGQTVLLSVLKAAATRAKKSHSDSQKLNYNILLILTDGVVNDLQSTKELVLKYHHLPLSVIVVGIGRADFTDMNQWNDEPVERRGRFTFVEFRKLQFDPAALSRKALERVPNEIVDYFARRNISR